MSTGGSGSRPETSKLRKRIIRYKRIIIQLVVIIVGCILMAFALFMLKGDESKDLRINLISTSAGLIAAAIISVADYFFLKKDEDVEISQTIGELIDLRKDLVTITSGSKGIVLHHNRNNLIITNRINNAKKQISIFVTNLDFLTSNFSDLVAAAKRNVEIRILGIKPTNLFIATRFHELNKTSAKSFFDEVKIHLDQLCEKLDEYDQDKNVAEHLKIRLYLSQPTHMIFWFDDQLVVSFILRQGRAREQIHIEFDLNDPAVAAEACCFTKDFELVWGEASPFTVTEIRKLCDSYNAEKMEAQGIAKSVNLYNLYKQNLPQKNETTEVGISSNSDDKSKGT